MTGLPEPAATIARLTEKLREDLAFAAPELWALHIERRLAQAYEAAEITEERLAAAITSLAHGRCCWDAPEDAREILAALATPVTPEGGEL